MAARPVPWGICRGDGSCVVPRRPARDGMGLDPAKVGLGVRLLRAACLTMRSIATILLLALALGLWAGPHPCHAGASAPAEAAARMATAPVVGAGEATAISTGAAEASCHGGAGHLAAAPARPAHHGGHHATSVDDPA